MLFHCFSGPLGLMQVHCKDKQLSPHYLLFVSIGSFHWPVDGMQKDPLSSGSNTTVPVTNKEKTHIMFSTHFIYTNIPLNTVLCPVGDIV